MGAAWGITQPLAKIAVSTGYRHIGLVFWQMAIGAVILGVISLIRRKGLPFHPRALQVYVVIALLGTVLPNSASYEAARFLPAGWMAVFISMVPMFAFPLALALGVDKFSVGRLGGLLIGLLGVVLLFVPVADILAGRGQAVDWALIAVVPLALVAPFFYGVEGNYVARWGTAGLDPVQVLFGASVVGAIIAAPMALAADAWITPALPLTVADGALMGGSVIHAMTYTGYVWLVGVAGSVFAAQVAYLVTAFGVGWSMLLLDERYGPEFFVALCLIFAGLFLVQPRQNAAETA